MLATPGAKAVPETNVAMMRELNMRHSVCKTRYEYKQQESERQTRMINIEVEEARGKTRQKDLEVEQERGKTWQKDLEVKQACEKACQSAAKLKLNDKQADVLISSVCCCKAKVAGL